MIDPGFLFSRTLTVWTRSLVPNLLIGLVILAPAYALESLALARVPDQALDEIGRAGARGGLRSMLAVLVSHVLLGGFLDGFIIHRSIELEIGRRPALRATLAGLSGRVFALIGAWFFMHAAFMAGLVTLGVMSFVWGAAWWLVSPILVAEHVPFSEAFRRSAQLTWGSRGLFAWALFLFYFLPLILIGFFCLAVKLYEPRIAVAVAWFLGALLQPLWSASRAVSYIALRGVREGARLDEIFA
jgi:hypothetical protein